MKTASILKVLIIFIVASSVVGFISLKKDALGRINFILGSPGDVAIRHLNQKNWGPARLFSTVFNGDEIKTNRESRCEIKLYDQSVIRIGENTTFTFQKNKLENKFNSEIKKGRLWANIRRLSRRSKFLVRTPTAVCSIRGTIYRIDADSSTKVLVYQGAVDVGPLWAAKTDTTQPKIQQKLQQPYEVPGPTEVPGPFEVTLDQWVKIVAGYQIEVRPDGKYAKSKIDEQLDKRDDWVRWNSERDSLK